MHNSRDLTRSIYCFLVSLSSQARFSSLRFPREDVRARHNLLQIARAEVGVREATGRNDGKRVEEYLATVGLPKGHPYCAAFISWVFKKAGYDQPRTAWSPVLFPARLQVKAAAPGNVFGIYFPAL